MSGNQDLLRLAELLCARLCHDLSGPLGALIGILDLAREEAPGSETVGLAEETAAELAQRLKLLLAYQVAAGQVPGMLAAIRGHAEAAGRDPDALECGLLVPTHVRADGAAARREARESFSRRWGRAVPDEVIEHLCIVGEPGECVEKVAAFAAAGVGELVLNPQSQTRDPVGDAEQLMADLAAPARAALA